MSEWQAQSEEDVECDKIQRIHTLENLAELLSNQTSNHGNASNQAADQRNRGSDGSQATEEDCVWDETKLMEEVRKLCTPLASCFILLI